MRKILLSIALGLSLFSYGQFKKVPVTDDEVQVLGEINATDFKRNSFFSEEERKKYNIDNCIGYIVDFVRNDKVIYSDFFEIENSIDGKQIIKKVNFNSRPYFQSNTFSDSEKLIFGKDTTWIFSTINGIEYIYFKHTYNKYKVIVPFTDNKKKYQIATFANDMILVKLYRLEKE